MKYIMIMPVRVLIRIEVQVCVYICVSATFSGENTDLLGTSSPYGDQRPVLMWQNVNSEVLVRVSLKLGFRIGVCVCVCTCCVSTCFSDSRA